MQHTLDNPSQRPVLSVIAPAHNEQDNIAPLVEQVRNAFEPLDICFEMIIVDDGSADQTSQQIVMAMRQATWLRCVRMRHASPGRGLGLSAALGGGIRAARGQLIAMLDADLQNDPADLPEMIRILHERNADMVHGDRSAARQDHFVRKCSSWVGRSFRRAVLRDTIRDTGCSLRVMKHHVAQQLPLHYKGAHRFIPFYARMLGFRVVELPVRHRPRIAGKAKYGVLNRALPGLHDLFAVHWMRHRYRSLDTEELHPTQPPDDQPEETVK